jgi:hypothetical protein
LSHSLLLLCLPKINLDVLPLKWAKAAKAMKGIISLGAVNADVHRDLGGQYGVRGFPTIKVFGQNKLKPTDYQGHVLVSPRFSPIHMSDYGHVLSSSLTLNSGY